MRNCFNRQLNIRASDYRFEDKKKYYRGFVNDKGKTKAGKKVEELKNLHDKYADFTEGSIIARKKQIINSFIDYLGYNNLLE